MSIIKPLIDTAYVYVKRAWTNNIILNKLPLYDLNTIITNPYKPHCVITITIPDIELKSCNTVPLNIIYVFSIAECKDSINLSELHSAFVDEFCPCYFEKVRISEIFRNNNKVYFKMYGERVQYITFKRCIT